MRRHPEEKNFYSTDDDAAEAFFRQAAQKEGLSYHEWCQRNGIVDRALLTKIFRHETASLDAYTDGSGVVGGDPNHDQEMPRGNRRVRTTGAVPAVVRLTSDFHTPPESPAKRRGNRRVNADAAE